MPRGKGGSRKKTRTHRVEEDGVADGAMEGKAGAAAAPRSFVFKSGRVSGFVKELAAELRRVVGPYTAAKLRERRRQRLKDYAAVATPLGVTHLLMLSQPDEAVNLKIARNPQGPTLTFRVEEFSLCRHVRELQRRPADPAGALKVPPLVVLNNFGGDERAHVRLAAVTLQNLFPAIDVAAMKLAQCRRVVLFHLDKDTDTVHLRHYCIRATPAGVNRGVRKVVRTQLPNLGKLEDVSEFIMGHGYTGDAGARSDSEAEDEAAQVVLPDKYNGRGNAKAQKSTVRLAELGPRMTMKLLKVERGLAGGDVLYHAHISKTPEEAAALRRAAAAKVEERKRRREAQEANVERKTAEREAKKAKREERRQERARLRAQAEAQGEGPPTEGGDEDDVEESADTDGDESDSAEIAEEALEEQMEAEADFDYSDEEGGVAAGNVEPAPVEYENEDDD